MMWPVSNNDAVGTVLRLDKNVYVDDTSEPSVEARPMFSDSKGRVRFFKRERIVSVAALLLRYQGTTVGIMFVNYRTRTPFSPALREQMRVCALNAAMFLWHAIRTRGTIPANPGGEGAFARPGLQDEPPAAILRNPTPMNPRWLPS